MKSLQITTYINGEENCTKKEYSIVMTKIGFQLCEKCFQSCWHRSKLPFFLSLSSKKLVYIFYGKWQERKTFFKRHFHFGIPFASPVESYSKRAKTYYFLPLYFLKVVVCTIFQVITDDLSTFFVVKCTKLFKEHFLREKKCTFNSSRETLWSPTNTHKQRKKVYRSKRARARNNITALFSSIFWASTVGETIKAHALCSLSLKATAFSPPEQRRFFCTQHFPPFYEAFELTSTSKDPLDVLIG